MGVGGNVWDHGLVYLISKMFLKNSGHSIDDRENFVSFVPNFKTFYLLFEQSSYVAKV